MAGMEQLEIHSKDYLIRWVNAAGGHTISWSLQPRKKTINFGVFRRVADSTNQASTTDDAPVQNASTTALPEGQTSSVMDKLERLGMRSVAWTGRCEADRVTMGQYEVPQHEDGMYGLVFDNTYSKQFSKTVTFVLMIYPSSAPPSGHHMHIAQSLSGRETGVPSVGRRSPKLRARSESNSSIDGDAGHVVLADPRPRSAHATESVTSLGASFYTGMLSKKRRKRNQGYARRFFSLDFTSATLSYYKNRNSSALRGAIPLSLAVISADDKHRQISVDSGAEVWLLRAPTQPDFEGWVGAIQRASRTVGRPGVDLPEKAIDAGQSVPDPAEERDWRHAEGLVGRVAGITDAMRRLAKDTDPKYLPAHSDAQHSDQGSPAEGTDNDYFLKDYKSDRPFWRRKSSNHSRTRMPAFKRNPSGQRLAPPSPDPSGSSNADTVSRQTSLPLRAPNATPQSDHSVHDHFMQVLRDLDAVVASFSSLIQQSRQRRTPTRPEPVSRTSLESVDGQDFYDAKETREDADSSFYKVDRDQEEESPERVVKDVDTASVDSTSTISEPDVSDSKLAQRGFLLERPTTLYPLPHEPVSRRNTINAAKGTPPSLISFLRKNVGKDLSTIAMPVTANEPLSLLQRSAENLEHARLLNVAAALTEQTVAAQTRRLLHVAAFAISPLANSRAKERAVRKPFNPMLGETYELVREDLQFRFVGEKVAHRPVRIAFQAEGAELLTDGRARVQLHELNECYSWAPPQCFLRNIIAGEKYMEPVGSMTVTEETSGRRAVITFKTGGMFSGRSEDVTVESYDALQRSLPMGLQGKWTTNLTLTGPAGADETIWEAGELVNGSSSRYGMTQFAMGLNEITGLEKDALPPTDSRLRPDQRAYEDGDIEKAEQLKHKLEERQRQRRAASEREGRPWGSRWFERVDADGQEEMWRLRREDGYWNARAAVSSGDVSGWQGLSEVFKA